MLNCKKITQAISAQQEKPLRLALRVEVHLHMMICPRCRAFAKNNQKLTAMTRAFCRESNDE